MPTARSVGFFVRVAILGFPLALAAGAVGAAPIIFPDPKRYDATDGFQQVLVSGDFDGDHQPDIALVHTSDGSVFWLANASGVLGPEQPIAMPFPVHMLAAGDLNGDGRADLVGCDITAAGGTIAVLLSQGAGFAPAITVPTDSAGVTGVTLADLDGDGDLDIVAGNVRTNRVSRVFNDGTGHFSGLVSTWVPDPAGRTWVADLNGDGRLDILTGLWPSPTFPTKLSWFLAGTGGGAFASPAPTGVSGVIALGAFSGPGSHDAVVPGYGIAHGLGNGTFAAPVITSAAPSSPLPWAAPIDMDGDGRDELLVGSDYGIGAFYVATFTLYRVSAGLSLVHRDRIRGTLGLMPAIVDLDADGHIDAVIGQARVVFNRGGRLIGLRTLLARLENDFDLDTQDADAGDLNGDGTADVLITDKHITSPPGYLFMSNHDGSFENSVGWQAQTYIRMTELADLNGDGLVDVLERHLDPGSTDGLYWALADGTGPLGAASFLNHGTLGPTLDADGDGDVDVIGGTSGLLLNDGFGQFTSASGSLPVTGTYGRVGGDVLPARFTVSGNSLSVERGASVGALGAPTLTPFGATLVDARFLDVNGDGRTDAVCLVNVSQVETFLGQPGGGLGPPILSPDAAISTGTPAFGPVGDLDGDGRPDLVFTNGTSLFSVLRNLGGGGFGERGESFSGMIGVPPLIADVDGDGVGDFVGLTKTVYSASAHLSIMSTDVLFGTGPAVVPTAALVSLSSASATFSRASLAWYVPSDGPSSLTLERRKAEGGWSAIGTLAPSAGRIAYEDAAVEPGATYSWRLAWEEDGATQHSDVATLAIPQLPRFAIAGVHPNPADGDRVALSLVLDRVAPVDVAVVDVAGRVVISRRVTPNVAGRLDVALDGVGSLEPALYFVRAEQAGRRATTRLIRLH